MFKKNRGTVIAAAAMSLALVAPAVSPIASAADAEAPKAETTNATEQIANGDKKADKPVKEQSKVRIAIKQIVERANLNLPTGTRYTVSGDDIEIEGDKIVIAENAKYPIEAVVTATLPNRGTRTITVSIDKPETGDIKINTDIDNGTCLAAGLGFGLPLLALIPLSIAAQFSMPVLAGVTEYYNQQIRNLNTEIQRQAGMLNPELAKQVEQIDRTLHSFGWSLGNAAAALAAGVGAAAAVAGIVYYCAPEVFLKAEVKTDDKKTDEAPKADETEAEGTTNEAEDTTNEAEDTTNEAEDTTNEAEETTNEAEETEATETETKDTNNETEESEDSEDAPEGEETK